MLIARASLRGSRRYMVSGRSGWLLFPPATGAARQAGGGRGVGPVLLPIWTKISPLWPNFGHPREGLRTARTTGPEMRLRSGFFLQERLDSRRPEPRIGQRLPGAVQPPVCFHKSTFLQKPVMPALQFEKRTESPARPLWVQCREFLLHGVESGMRVLDVGCGEGALLRAALAQGCDAVGMEVVPELVQQGRAAGGDVRLGAAEALPFEDQSFDAILCSVVLPYTDERLALKEFHRVLRPNGFANVTGHGVGYALDLWRHGAWRQKLYASRMLLNTGCYAVTGRRLPGILGDTLCERIQGMRAYARAAGLQIEREEWIGQCGGAPRFLAQRFRKPVRGEA